MLIGTTASGGSIAAGDDQLASAAPVVTSWHAKAAIPAPEEGGGVDSINGIVYVAGGGVPNEGVLSNLQGFDPTSNAWLKNLPNMPGALAEPDIVADINGILYVAGGEDNNGSYFSSLYAYNPVTNSWATEAGMPHPSADGCGGVIDGVLYVTTGYDGSEYSTDLDAYDPVSNTWSSLAPSNDPHFAPACGVINGKLYVAGGMSAGNKVTDTVEVYDPTAGAWTSLDTKGWQPTSYPASAALDGRLYVVGGCTATPCSGRNLTNNVYIYDATKSKWSFPYKNLPAARSNFAATISYGLIFVEGGGNSKGNVTNANAYLAVKPSIP
jgi:N-acetylneuraminic acid mutarotase